MFIDYPKTKLLQLCSARTVWYDPVIRPDSVPSGKFTTLIVTNDKQTNSGKYTSLISDKNLIDLIDYRVI